MLNGSNNVNDNLPQITSEISKILSNSLKDRSILSHEVQGFTEYHFLSWTNRIPMQIENLFGPKFNRNFDPSLQSAIEDIKSNNQLDKTQLHAVLLEKYLGIVNSDNVDETFSLKTTIEPNAYHSLPNQNDDDYFLHLYFLQPFRLFGISQENRKYIAHQSETCNREWLWHSSHEDGDVAPIFRKIIQVYILNAILQDYKQNVNDAKNPLIEENMALFMKLHKTLLNDIKNEFQRTFDNIAELPTIENSPNGIIHNNGTMRSLDRQFPGFMDVIGSYPIGRLLFGQPLVEPRHEVARRELSQNSLSAKAKYAFFWLFAHLNLATSIFWVRTAFEICKLKWRNFKNYVTNPQIPLTVLLLQSILFIPNAFILISTPLLIALPWMYGVTSIPFTLLRSFFMHGPFEALRKFKYIKIIDSFEFFKDTFLFFWFALPVLDIFVGLLTGILPAAVLTVGAITAGALVFAALVVLDLWSGANTDRITFDLVEAVATTRYFQLVGSVLFFGVGAYMALAVISQKVAPFIPQTVSNGISHLLSGLTAQLGNTLRPFFANNANIELSELNLNTQEEPILLPKIATQFEISEKMQKEIDQLREKLGMLNSSLHISAERKKAIRALLSNLEVKPDSTEEAVEAEIEKASKIVKNNFTPEEAGAMSKLLTYLKERNPELATRLEMSSIEGVGNRGGYQPSSNMLKELVNKGHLNETEKSWNLPSTVPEFTRKTAKKCIRLGAVN